MLGTVRRPGDLFAGRPVVRAMTVPARATETLGHGHPRILGRLTADVEEPA